MRQCGSTLRLLLSLHKRSGGFTMSLAVYALTHALRTLRHWFSDNLGIIIMLRDGVNTSHIHMRSLHATVLYCTVLYRTLVAHLYYYYYFFFNK